MLLLHAWFCLNLPAQAEKFRLLGIDEGLPGDCVYKVLKDSRGYMWIGTNNGLVLYDGRQLTPVPCDVRKGDNLVHDIVELPDGAMAVAMRGGLFRVDFPGLQTRPFSQQVGPVRALLAAGGSLYIGSDRGLALADLRTSALTWLTLGTSVLSRDNHILDLVQGEKGTVWVIGQYAVHRLPAGKEAQRIPLPSEVLESGLRCGAWTGRRLYVGTSGSGVYRIDTSSGACEQVRENVGSVIFDLHAGASQLYIASDGDGAYVYDLAAEKVTESFCHPPLPTNSVYTFWRDETLGVNWFGFYREGLAHTFHQRQTAVPYSMDTFDSRQYPIRSFCRRGHHLAIGTREGLYLVNEEKASTRHYDKTQMGGGNVLSIVWFNGRFVVATYDGGLCTIDPATGRCERPLSPLLRKGTFMKVVVKDDRTLMALSNRIVLLNENLEVTNMLTDRNSELKGDMLTDAFIDRSGKAWLSSESGLALFDMSEGIVKKSGFPQGFFNREPVLTFGAWKGQGVMAAGERVVYRCREDLSAWDSLDIVKRLDVNSISFIVPQDSCYWVGTDRGLFYMDSLLVRFRHIGTTEGLSSSFCNPQSWQLTDDGDFWFSTRAGVHHVHPRDLLSLGTTADGSDFRVVLTEISVGGRTYTPVQCVESTERRALDVRWNFGTETVRLKPLVMDYSSSRGSYLEWQVDEGDILAVSERQPIELSGLSIGTHELRIYAPGSRSATVYVIRVLPSPLFWFEVLFFLALAAIAVLLRSYQQRLVKYRSARRRKHQLDMKLAAEQSVNAYRQSELRRQQEEAERRREHMYQKSKSTEDENRRLLGQLKEWMEREHAYRKPNLRVADVAAAIGCSSNKLSQMFSLYAEVSFNDFVNDYRIREFKQKILSQDYAHLSMLAVAESCGFKKTTFYAAFNKKENSTPAEWLHAVRCDETKAETSSSKHSELSLDET